MDARLRAQFLVIAVLLLSTVANTVGCNLNDPDVLRGNDPSDTGSEISDDDAATDANVDAEGSDASEDADAGHDADTDTCSELSVPDFCSVNSAECGSFAGPGRCESMRTEICGSCNAGDACIDNTCACISPWTGDGIDAAFERDSRVYVTNLGFMWAFDTETGNWTARTPLSSSTSPIDFTRSPAVDGTSIWDNDGPTAAVSLEKSTLFLNGSLYWVYHDEEAEWVASGDLAATTQAHFQLRRDSQGGLFGDNTVRAAFAEDKRQFYLVNGDVAHEFDLQDLFPVEIEQKSVEPVPLGEFFTQNWFEAGSTARPWDQELTWSTYRRNSFTDNGFVVLGGKNNGSWWGPDNGPLTYEEVGPSSDIYGGAACPR